MMRLTHYDHARQFLDDWQPVLVANEVANGLLLGITLRVAESPEFYGELPVFIGVADEAGPVAAAIMTPPFNLLVRVELHEKRDVAFELMAGHLAPLFPQLPGVNGEADDSRRFAEIWRGEQLCSAQPVMNLRCFELLEVIDPPKPPGAARLAESLDLELMTDWILLFTGETGASTPATATDERARAKTMAERNLELGNIWLWEDNGAPVAMAACGRTTINGNSINLVYTPAELRRRGYATALVAVLSRDILERGWRFVTLFTDLANPVSNSIYRKIGYRPVADFVELEFRYDQDTPSD
ncbi:MAG: GNAT family N-acetyltransferase [bacterium]|nr:GNAT family N-acetyltransferase [bacterium]